MKKLTKTGNTFAIVLNRPLLEEAQIGPDTPLEVSTDGHVIVISPVPGEKRAEKLKRAADRVHRRYAGVFARLAK